MPDSGACESGPLLAEKKDLAAHLGLGIQEPCRPPFSWNARTLPPPFFFKAKNLAILLVLERDEFAATDVIVISENPPRCQGLFKRWAGQEF